MTDNSLVRSSGPMQAPYEDAFLAQLDHVSRVLADARVEPDPAIAIVKALRGAQLGLCPVTSQSALYAFRGRGGAMQVGVWTRDMLGLVRARGIRVVLEHDPTDPGTEDKSFARWAAWLGEDKVTASYTRADAESAGLWAKWTSAQGIIPAHMMTWRAASRLIERHLSHVLGGLPTVEALQESREAEEPIRATVSREEVVSRMKAQAPARPPVVDAESEPVPAEAPTVASQEDEYLALLERIEEALGGVEEDMADAMSVAKLPEVLPDGDKAAAGAMDRARRALKRAELVHRWRMAERDAIELDVPVPELDPWRSKEPALVAATDALFAAGRVAMAGGGE